MMLTAHPPGLQRPLVRPAADRVSSAWGIVAPEEKIDALTRELAALRRALEAHERAPFGEGLREREALLSEAERIVHLGSWMWDTVTDTIRWSDELFRIFGLPADTTLDQRTFFDHIHKDDVERVRAEAARTLETHEARAIDFRIVRQDDSVRDVHMDAVVVRSTAGLRLVGTVLDVTERREMEARLYHAQKMEAIGTLAGGVAHDFNNYLHVILGNVDIMLGRVADPREMEDGLVQIREAASRAQHLTRQLLLLGRQKVARPAVVSLDAVLDDAMPMLGTLVGDRIRIRRIRAASELRVRIDPASLEQVVLNLALNARDAMPRGGRLTFDPDTIDVEEDETLAPGRYVVLSIEDEGSGISAAVLPRIFEPFYTTKAPGRGTGLGLPTAFAIVAEAGGSIRVETRAGAGSTFRILLPLVTDGVSARTRRRGLASAGTVLLVDDQPDVRRLVRLILEDERFDVLEAEDGVDAVRLLGMHADVSLIVSDVSMPKMTGRELAQRLARERPELPVILMGGVIDSSVSGSSAHVLGKPFRREDLVAAIEAVRKA